MYDSSPTPSPSYFSIPPSHPFLEFVTASMAVDMKRLRMTSIKTFTHMWWCLFRFLLKVHPTPLLIHKYYIIYIQNILYNIKLPSFVNKLQSLETKMPISEVEIEAEISSNKFKCLHESSPRFLMEFHKLFNHVTWIEWQYNIIYYPTAFLFKCSIYCFQFWEFHFHRLHYYIFLIHIK